MTSMWKADKIRILNLVMNKMFLLVAVMAMVFGSGCTTSPDGNTRIGQMVILNVNNRSILDRAQVPPKRVPCERDWLVMGSFYSSYKDKGESITGEVYINNYGQIADRV